MSANPLFSPVLYFLGKQFTSRSFDWIWRRAVFGRENIPPAGHATIIAANHRSLADPNLVGSAVPYPIHYFAKEELFNIPVLGWYIRRVNAFPVKRGEGDVGAFKTAAKILRHGETLLLFPEGGRRLDPKKQFVAKAGVGMLAGLTGAQVLPVGVIHSERFTKLAKVTVRFGRVMPPPVEKSREAYTEFSQRVMDEIRRLVELGGA